MLEEPPAPAENSKILTKTTNLKEALVIHDKYVRDYVEGFAKSKTESVAILGATSFVFPSFTAYLTEAEAKNYANDKRVTKITEDRYATTSSMGGKVEASSLLSGAEVEGWGLAFMNNANPPLSTGQALVHVIDGGTESHPDLDTNRNNANNYYFVGPSQYYKNPVGCYPHATHVAGIIGAKKNGVGAVGMVPGVNIISHAVSDTNIVWWEGTPTYGSGYYDLANPNVPQNLFPYDGHCSGTRSYNYIGSPVTIAPSITQSSVIAALNHVVYETILHGTGVVNMSMNGPDFYAKDLPVGQAMLSVVTPSVRYFFWFGTVFYRGSLIVQSAGNDNNSDACNVAYNATLPGDGIIVAGGIGLNGQRLGSTSSYVNIFTEASPLTVAPHKQPGQTVVAGSNYGSCVEMYAPSESIYSTWTTNSSPSPYRELTGTSMAAPHVAGFAAALIERYPAIGWTAHTLEAYVAAHLVPAVPGSTLLVPKF